MRQISGKQTHHSRSLRAFANWTHAEKRRHAYRTVNDEQHDNEQGDQFLWVAFDERLASGNGGHVWVLHEQSKDDAGSVRAN